MISRMSTPGGSVNEWTTAAIAAKVTRTRSPVIPIQRSREESSRTLLLPIQKGVQRD